MTDEVTLGARPLRFADVIAVSRGDVQVTLGAHALERLQRSGERVVTLSESGDPVYGVSTGFGALSTTRIERDRWGDLQESLVLSHASGMGAPVEREVVRAMMLLRAHTLAFGYSGVHPRVV